MNTARADLFCETYDRVSVHEVRYAGRLVDGVRCTECQGHLDLRGRALLPAYLADLEHRILSKPGRMLHRAARDPVGFARSLPHAVLRQPGKFLGDLRELLRR